VSEDQNTGQMTWSNSAPNVSNPALLSKVLSWTTSAKPHSTNDLIKAVYRSSNCRHMAKWPKKIWQKRWKKKKKGAMLEERNSKTLKRTSLYSLDCKLTLSIIQPIIIRVLLLRKKNILGVMATISRIILYIKEDFPKIFQSLTK